ncbi:hypothetical protein CEXT_313751 [Caerostris extrusa]|uniref:Uncharacterized protein n=1 Tax=Caerostris extrusa TaxID=172846 RepID=A0AAV4QEN4_CAEEX|nr:hypothetical protein CEXT_313751 [Caerostris extrusa]
MRKPTQNSANQATDNFLSHYVNRHDKSVRQNVLCRIFVLWRKEKRRQLPDTTDELSNGVSGVLEKRKSNNSVASHKARLKIVWFALGGEIIARRLLSICIVEVPRYQPQKPNKLKKLLRTFSHEPVLSPSTQRTSQETNHDTNDLTHMIYLRAYDGLDGHPFFSWATE